MSALVSSDVLPFEKIPGPRGHWLKGNLDQIDREAFHLFVYQQARDYGVISKFHVMRKPMVVLSRPETVKWILKNRPSRFRRLTAMELITREMGIHGVFSAEGNDWKRQRLLMNSAFKPSQVKNFYPTIHAITQRLCKALQVAPRAVDIPKVFMSYTVDVTSALAFGSDVNTLENPHTEIQQNLNKIFPMLSFRLHSPIPYWRWFKLARDRELEQALQFVKQRVSEFIQAARQRIEQKPHTGTSAALDADNILEAMILAQAEDGDSFTEQELFGNVITLLLAGEDTTANTLAWAIDYLADKPELQDQMYKEIQANHPTSAADEGAALSFDDLDKFPLTFAAAQESMRLKPVAPYLYLEAYQDEVIEGYEVPKGTMLVTLLSNEGINARLFPDPQAFKPQRWLNLSDKTRKQYAAELMPFGFGARLCPGRQLSFVEMKLALIELLRRFKFSRHPGYSPAKEIFAFTVVPDNLVVDVLPRQTFG